MLFNFLLIYHISVVRYEQYTYHKNISNEYYFRVKKATKINTYT